MNIITDIEEINIREGKAIHKEEEALQGIKDFFVQALIPLQQDIEKEEGQRECKILIHILPPMEQWSRPKNEQEEGLHMTLHGYTDELSIKIHQAISGIVDASMEKFIPGQNPN